MNKDITNSILIKLEPFTESDFETFKSWVINKEELFQFAGSIFTFPISNEQLINYINMPDLRPYKVVLKATNENIGHCELNYEDGKNRLSRILIGKKELRGKKIGEQIVREMVKLLFENPEVKEVDLNAFDFNKGAIKCYEKVGFTINPKVSEKINVYGTYWIRINMILKRKNR